MRELVSLPGLQLYIYGLKRQLQCELSVQGKPARSFKLSEEDFEDTGQQATQDIDQATPRAETSAVGLHLALAKTMAFWSFNTKDTEEVFPIGSSEG